MSNKIRVLLLFVGDIIALYLGLFVTLFLRYGSEFYSNFTEKHFLPFTIVFALWIIIFYITGLYDLRHSRNTLEFIQLLGTVLLVSAIAAILLFYLVPAFGIAPKTNLFLFVIIFSILHVLWRRLFNATLATGEPPNKVFVIEDGSGREAMNEILASKPEWVAQLGYKIAARMDENRAKADPAKVETAVEDNSANIIVVPRHIKNSSAFTGILYNLLNKGIEIMDMPTFYETITRKVPLSIIEETWFLENLTKPAPGYEALKRLTDTSFAIIILVVTLPFWPLIALLIRIESKGSIIIKQKRVGKNKKEFTLHKFRSMTTHNNHKWPDKNDLRITRIGKILRRTHADELPQAINILLGDISLVGPRPDFVDFFKDLDRKIPYYSARTLVRPGLTGWAQVHLPVTASLEETKERLGYDFYYLKHRSIILDLAIILKTFKILFTAKGL
ncbi:MAG: exopolysaccharide biosynthesis polyprenyl glycosylphosphotransferase [Patescibacteria group bacterium]